MAQLYDLLATGAILAGSPYLAWRWLRHRDEMKERLGAAVPPARPHPVWWHAASLGELEALGPVLREAKRRDRAASHAVTVMTPAGRRRAEDEAGDGMAIAHVPLDWFPLVRRRFDLWAPRCLILVETELWPALLGEARRRRLPTAIVNGRISPVNFRKYNRLRWLFHSLLEDVQAVAARTERDAEAFVNLGARRAAVRVTGNTKYALPRREDGDGCAWVGQGWRGLLVLGSVRSAEQEDIRRAVETLCDGLSGGAPCLVVVAPRHPERSGALARALRDLGPPVLRRSDLREPLDAAGRGHTLVLLDTLGELREVWWRASAGFVGGSLVPLGGHNLFEAASRGCPLAHGPSVDTVSDMAEALAEHGGARVVNDGRALGRFLVDVMRDAGLRDRMSQGARAAAATVSGAATRTVDWLHERGVFTEPGGP